MSDRHNRQATVAVIGAGFAGLSAAQVLEAAGRQVVLFDKGRGPGGRASTRHRHGVSFDHGAQYFTVHDSQLARRVEAWGRAGVVARWDPRLVVFDAEGIRRCSSEHKRYVGVPGMSSVAVHLAQGLDLRSRIRVARVAPVSTGLELFDEDGRSLIVADTVLITTPPAQATPLLTEVPQMAEETESVRMHPCWAVLLAFDHPLAVEFDAAFVNDGPLSWIARNSSKPAREGKEAWVLHASMEWSERNLDREVDSVIATLQADFLGRCGQRSSAIVSHAEAHRWRFAQPESAIDRPYLYDPDRRIGVAGDWCAGPRIEGAILSGIALAEQVLEAKSKG